MVGWGFKNSVPEAVEDNKIDIKVLDRRNTTKMQKLYYLLLLKSAAIVVLRETWTLSLLEE